MNHMLQKQGCMGNARWTVSIAASLLFLAACSQGTHAAKPTAAPKNPKLHQPTTPQISTGPTPTPAPATPPVITPTPGAPPSAIPTAPRIVKRVPRLRPNAAPQILAIAVSETTVQRGDRVSANVLTSSNVASVEARIGGYGMTLSKVGVGRFTLAYTVGQLPWFLRGNFTMQVIARNTRGDAVARAIPLTVR